MRKFISFLLVLTLLLCVGGCAAFKQEEPETAEQKMEREIQVLNSVYEGFDEAQSTYMDGGYVKKDSVHDCLQSAYEYALTLEENGTAEYVKFEEENLCVICKLVQGDKVVFVPKMEDTKAGGGTNRIVTAQPYYNTSIKSDAPDQAAKNVASAITSYKFADNDNLDNKAVDLQNLKKLTGAKVIIWDGHGGYDSEDHSLTWISASYNAMKKSKEFGAYCDGERVISDGSGESVLTPAFFRDFYQKGDLNGAVIYLGTCLSGRDSVLANALLKNGAGVVFANTFVTQTGYDGKMIKSIFSAMADGKTAEKALNIAKKKNGAKGAKSSYDGVKARTEVICFGNGSIKLSNKVKNKKDSFINSSIGKKLIKNSWSFANNLNTGLSEILSFDKTGKVTEKCSTETTQETAYSTCKLINDTTVEYVIKYKDGFSNKVTISLIDDSQFLKAIINNSQVTGLEDVLYNSDTVNYDGSVSEFDRVLIGDWRFSGDTPLDTIHIYEYEYGVKASVTFKNGEIVDEIPVFTFSNTFAKTYVFDSDGNRGVTLLFDRASDTKMNLISLDDNNKINLNYGVLIKQ